MLQRSERIMMYNEMLERVRCGCWLGGRIASVCRQSRDSVAVYVDVNKMAKRKERRHISYFIISAG